MRLNAIVFFPYVPFDEWFGVHFDFGGQIGGNAEMVGDVTRTEWVLYLATIFFAFVAGYIFTLFLHILRRLIRCTRVMPDRIRGWKTCVPRVKRPSRAENSDFDCLAPFHFRWWVRVYVRYRINFANPGKLFSFSFLVPLVACRRSLLGAVCRGNDSVHKKHLKLL